MKVNTKNTSQTAIIENRRHMVAELRLRGATQREIIELLAKQGMTNNGKPWSVGIINRDIQHLENEWRKAAVRDMSTLKSNQLAEIRSARRQAWKDKNLAEVRQLIKLEIDLLGTAAPTRHDVTWRSEVMELVTSGRVTIEQVEQELGDELATELFNAAGIPAVKG